jgi:hypothetical protein
MNSVEHDDRPEVLVTVGLDVTGVARLPKILHDAGCKVSLFAPSGLAITRSRFVDTHIVGPNRSDSLVDALRDHLTTNRDRYKLLIVGDQPLLNEIAERKSESWVAKWFPVDVTSAAVDLITSKSAFLASAAGAQLKIPSLRFCKNVTEARVAAKEFGYPLVLKVTTGFNGPGVRVVYDPIRLDLCFEELSGDDIVAVQRYVFGKTGQTEVLFSNGKPVCWSSSFTCASWPDQRAASCIREMTDHQDIERLLEGVGKVTGFNGFGSIDWVQDPAGALFLIGFNPRPTPGYHLGKSFDADFSAAISSMLRGDVAARPVVNLSKKSNLIHMFPECCYLAIDRRDPMLFLRSLSDAPWSDPSLLAAFSIRILTHYFPFGLKKRVKQRTRRSTAPLLQPRNSL